MSKVLKRVIAAALFAAPILTAAGYYSGGPAVPTTIFYNNDLDCVHHAPATENKIVGHGMINRKVAIVAGVVVAYHAGVLDRAVASAKFERDGSFIMENVPMGELEFLIKPALTRDVNPLLVKAGGDLRSSAIAPGLPPSTMNNDELKRKLTKKQLSKFEMSELVEGRSLPPEAKWFLDQAFEKFGNNLKGSGIRFNVDQPENRFDIDVTIEIP